MSDRPLAYHITFGTYGARLHGDPRGTVIRELNRITDPIIGNDPRWRQKEIERLKFPSVELTLDMRKKIESLGPAVCSRGGWTFHNIAAGRDHVHLLLSADAEGNAVRRWAKTWLGQELSRTWPLQDGATWWAEGGSVKWIWDQRYLEQAFVYIDQQRASGVLRNAGLCESGISRWESGTRFAYNLHPCRLTRTSSAK
ncbi:MAG: hypothetical protein IT440_11125 [Phycisphaeraceae bacterium]|nr:hypothetical protein [Phycisphaeraceae bacterium]